MACKGKCNKPSPLFRVPLDKTLEGLVKQAVDSNIVVYDRDSEKGIYSQRLDLLLGWFAGENKLDVIKTIDRSPEVTKLYLEAGGSLPANKESIALITTDKGYVFLGAY